VTIFIERVFVSHFLDSFNPDLSHKIVVEKLFNQSLVIIVENILKNVKAVHTKNIECFLAFNFGSLCHFVELKNPFRRIDEKGHGPDIFYSDFKMHFQ
jgi:hypothetical protein